MRVRSGILALLVLPVLLTGAAGARAAIWDPFGGYVDLAAVQAETNGLERNSLRQDYNAYFEKRLTPFFRSALPTRSRERPASGIFARSRNGSRRFSICADEKSAPPCR